MVRFGMVELRDKALLALEEALEQCREQPVRQSFSLRFVLAFLGNFAADREPFDEFWRAIAEPKQPPRYGAVNVALNRIYRSIGAERDHALSLRLRRSASERDRD